MINKWWRQNGNWEKKWISSESIFDRECFDEKLWWKFSEFDDGNGSEAICKMIIMYVLTKNLVICLESRFLMLKLSLFSFQKKLNEIHCKIKMFRHFVQYWLCVRFWLRYWTQFSSANYYIPLSASETYLLGWKCNLF